MLFDFLKTPVTTDELAGSLYAAVVRDVSQNADKMDSRTDQTGNPLFSKEERMLILLAHLHQLFESRKLEKAQMLLIVFCARDYYKVKTKDALAEKIVDLTVQIQEINAFFKNLPPLHELTKGKFLFDKKFNVMDIPLALHSCVLDKQIVDSAFKIAFSKFRIKDA